MKVFNCPQCAATLEFERIDAPLVRCQFCDSLVVVPAELRPPPADSAQAPPRRGPQLDFGERDQPQKVALAIVALLVIAVGIGLLVAMNRSSNVNGVTPVNATRTPFRLPTPTPAPKPDGYTVAYTVGAEGTGPGLFKDSLGVAVDGAGRVYVCESFDKIHVYEPDGRFVRTLKIPHAADALTFDAQNNLYIAGRHMVSKLVLDK